MRREPFAQHRIDLARRVAIDREAIDRVLEDVRGKGKDRPPVARGAGRGARFGHGVAVAEQALVIGKDGFVGGFGFGNGIYNNYGYGNSYSNGYRNTYGSGYQSGYGGYQQPGANFLYGNTWGGFGPNSYPSMSYGIGAPRYYAAPLRRYALRRYR